MEKFKGVELQQNKVDGEEQVSCELEGGRVMFETSVEAIEPYDFEINNLYMFAGENHDDGRSSYIATKKKEERQNLNFVLKEDETARSHVEAHTQLKEGIAFQHIARAENRGSLAYTNSQRQEG